MDKCDGKLWQVTERAVSLLMAGGLGYLVLSNITWGAVIAWGVVGVGAGVKLILSAIARKPTAES